MSIYFAYSSATKMRHVQKDWALIEGEILFDHEPTAKELELAFGLEANSVERAQQTAMIAAERYKREGVGITVDGFAIDTSRDGQALIAGAAVSSILDPAYTCNWKTGVGFVERNAAQLIAIATAVRAHVQACFDREHDLLLAVEAGDYRAEMLTEGWPDSMPDPVADPESDAQ